MNPATDGSGRLADQPLLQSIQQALTSGPDANETIVFAVGLVAFVLLILVAARCFARERRAGSQPQIDYLTLAVDLLGLSERDRHDLETIARLAGLEQPAVMLLSPGNLACSLAAAPPSRIEGPLRERVGQLCMRLFDMPLPAPDGSPA